MMIVIIINSQKTYQRKNKLCGANETVKKKQFARKNFKIVFNLKYKKKKWTGDVFFNFTRANSGKAIMISPISVSNNDCDLKKGTKFILKKFNG